MHENVVKMATIMNELGFSFGNRNVIGTDVLTAKLIGELHETAVKLFKQK